METVVVKGSLRSSLARLGELAVEGFGIGTCSGFGWTTHFILDLELELVFKVGCGLFGFMLEF